MPDPCPHCGVALAWATRACPRCGTRLRDPVPGLGPDRAPGDATESVPTTGREADPAIPPPRPPAAPARPGRRVGARSWWSQSRHRSFVAIAVCAVVLGAAVGLAFGVGNQGVVPNRVAPARHHRRLVARRPSPPPAVRAVSADAQRQVAYLSSLESLLQQASAGRIVLVGALRGAPGGCAMPPGAAAVLVNTVVQNRTSLLNQLGALPPAPNPEAQRLEQLLAAALHASSQADSEYEAWLYATGLADPQSCSASSSPTIALYWNSARASDSTATAAKAEFVTAFDPVAALFGLPTWTPSQF